MRGFGAGRSGTGTETAGDEGVGSLHLPVLDPSALASIGQEARRARRRRIAWTGLLIVLMVVPGAVLLVALRSAGPADGTLTYPNHWSRAGVEIQGVANPGSGDQDCPDGLAEHDLIVKVDGAEPVAGSVDSRRLGDSLRFRVLRTVDGEEVTCFIDVPLGRYPWRTLVSQYLLALPMVIVMCLVAGFVFPRRPRDPAARALVAAAAVLPYTGLAFPFGTQVVDLIDGSWLWPHLVGDGAYLLLWGTLLHFALAFPQPIPWLRRRGALFITYLLPVLPWAVYAGLREVAWSGSGHGMTSLDRLNYLASLSVPASWLGPGVIAAISWWQYRRASSESERRSIRLLIWTGVTTAAIFAVLFPIPRMLSGQPLIEDRWIFLLVLGSPLVLGAGVLQYGLFDVQVLLSRSLVYGALTFLLVVIPVALGVSVTAWIAPGSATDLLDARGLNVILVTVLLAALFFHPVQNKLNRLVSKMVFGSRDDPYEVVTQLGSGLTSQVDSGILLASMAQTVSQSLRLPYVAIEVTRPGGVRENHEFGVKTEIVQTLPLTYRGEEVGRLLLGSGQRTEPFGPADQRLLQLLAQQVGASAQNILLAERLQRSLTSTVAAREEERRRLRRDIHDGLGPMLVAVRMRLEVALRLLPTEPAKSAALLDDLVTTQQTIIDDVRRLVDGLRPPVLDHLGLVAAIRQHAEALSTDSHAGINVNVSATTRIETLPAAVEVAAYRIAVEAATNATRHSAATRCEITLRQNDALEILVADDGVGLPVPYRAGVGLTSMRERAAEVGGTCSISSIPGSGTTVSAWLPVRGTPLPH